MAIRVIGLPETDPLNGVFHDFVIAQRTFYTDESQELRAEAAELLLADGRPEAQLTGAAALLEIALIDQDERDIKVRRRTLYDARDVFRTFEDPRTTDHVAAQIAIASIPIYEKEFLKREHVSKREIFDYVSRLMAIGSIAADGRRTNRRDPDIAKEFVGLGTEAVALAVVNHLVKKWDGGMSALPSTISQDRDTGRAPGYKTNWDLGIYSSMHPKGGRLSITRPDSKVQVKARRNHGAEYLGVDVIYFNYLLPKDELVGRKALWDRIAGEYEMQGSDSPLLARAKEVIGTLISS